MKVNGITREEAIKYLKSEFDIWRKRSQQEWKLNIDYLAEYMGPDFKFKRPVSIEENEDYGEAF